MSNTLSRQSDTWFPDPLVPPLRGGPRLRWGILGPGFIAEAFASTVTAHTDQQIVAVGSRSRERAAVFAAAHGIDAVHEGAEQLVADPRVDIVYIATPQVEHARLALLAISAGKHVLIEKPIALSGAEAEQIAAAARAAGVFAAEAMWTRYLPQFDVIDQVRERGDLGTIRLATADVGWRKGADAEPRFLDPAQGGGAALDMGIYGYWFAHFAIGRAERLTATGSLLRSGVDEQSAVTITGAGARLATVTTTMAVTNSGLAGVYGTGGSVQFLEPFVHPASFVADIGGTRHEWKEPSGLRMRDGLAFQAAAIADCIAEGHRESPVHSLDDSVEIMRMIDEVRSQLGVG